MLLPQKFNEEFSVQWLSEGKELRGFTEDELKSILPFDPRCVERQRLRRELLEKIITPLIALFNKNLVLKGVLISIKEPSNRFFYNMIQDSARQNITDFYDLMEKFIDTLNRYKNNYSPLFSKGSQEKLFMALIQGNSLENIQKYCELSDLIDKKRNYLLSDFDSNGRVKNESWDRLINNMRAIRNIIKTYRDKVASHADKESVSLSWQEATQAIEAFANYVSDISVVLSFHNRFEMISENMNQDNKKIIKTLRKILFNED